MSWIGLCLKGPEWPVIIAQHHYLVQHEAEACQWNNITACNSVYSICLQHVWQKTTKEAKTFKDPNVYFICSVTLLSLQKIIAKQGKYCEYKQIQLGESEWPHQSEQTLWLVIRHDTDFMSDVDFKHHEPGPYMSNPSKMTIKKSKSVPVAHFNALTRTLASKSIPVQL